jgi:hypothetical protein
MQPLTVRKKLILLVRQATFDKGDLLLHSISAYGLSFPTTHARTIGDCAFAQTDRLQRSESYASIPAAQINAHWKDLGK